VVGGIKMSEPTSTTQYEYHKDLKGEIDRLKEEIKKSNQHDVIVKEEISFLTGQLDKLKQQNEKYREALRFISVFEHNTDCDDFGDCDLSEKSIAKEALKEGGDND
jgi:predicted RNase H-like nuclease (RuvC/YqgF family)